MSTEQTTTAVAPGGLADTMADRYNTPIATPEEALEKPGSLSSHDSDRNDVDARQPDEDMPPAKPVQSSTESIYPPGRTVAFVMIALLLAMFLNALDRTIISTAIPKITDEFDSLSDVGWYGSAYLLTCCCFQMLWGRIYTFYTPKYVFLIVIFLFEVGSALCGAAPNSIAFIIGRAIAGIGAAGIQNGAILLMVSVLPLSKRPKYQGLFGAVFGVASVVGPLLGELTSSQPSSFFSLMACRRCFYQRCQLEVSRSSKPLSAKYPS